MRVMQTNARCSSLITGLVALTLAAIGTACNPFERVRNGVDRWSFSHSGGTVFSEPFQVTTKQLHLDTGTLFGQEVVLEGDVQEIGDDHTHLVLGDGEGRMLVVLTELESAYQDLDRRGVQRVRVLGRLERGKKGLPYIRAGAIRRVDGPTMAEEEREKEKASEQAHGKVPTKSPAFVQ